MQLRGSGGKPTHIQYGVLLRLCSHLRKVTLGIAIYSFAQGATQKKAFASVLSCQDHEPRCSKANGKFKLERES
jgi:hypothetical protein